VRAALGAPARDLATTRFGTFSYAIVRRLPRGLIDRVGRRQMRRLARKGHFASSAMAGEFNARLADRAAAGDAGERQQRH
jgi:hypothetical protein